MDCQILLTETLTIREAIKITVSTGISTIIIGHVAIESIIDQKHSFLIRFIIS